MTKRTYRKINKTYWEGEHYFNKLGIAIIAFILFSLAHFNIQKYVNSQPLISPVVIEQKKWDVYISCEDPVGYIRCKFYQKELDEKQAILLIAIAKAESGLNPEAKNPHSSARGLFQVLARTWYDYDCVGDKYDFKDNTNCAIKIMSKDGGFRAWSVFNTGSYKRYLKGIEI